TDQISGRVALVTESRSGRVENLDHGLITEENIRERFEIDPANPRFARAVCDWEQELAREDWSVRTEARAEMRSEDAGLVFHASLRAWEGEDIVFEREFNETIARKFV
ncbi:MAG: peptidase S15, partial [Pseudorhodobacter sp.]